MPCIVALTAPFKKKKKTSAPTSSLPKPFQSSQPSSFLLTLAQIKTYFDRQRSRDITNMCIFAIHFNMENKTRPPASTQPHRETEPSLPLAAGRRRRGQPWICSACYLMSIGMSPWGPSRPVPASQAGPYARYQHSLSNSWQTAYPAFSLSSSPTLHLCQMRLSLSASDNKQAEAQVCSASHPPPSQLLYSSSSSSPSSISTTDFTQTS